MSDVSSLENSATSLSQSIDWWNNVYVAFFLIAVIATAVTLLAQRKVIVTNRKLLGVNSEIARQKEADANEKSQKLEQATAEARTKQAEAERTLLEIQQRFTPRTLIGEQRDAFIKKLADSPKGKVEVSVTTGDPEAYTFAAQLWNALKDAGFDVGDQLVSFTIFGPPPMGVIIGVKDKYNQPPYGGEIQQALQSVGIKVSGQAPLGSEVDIVYIRVGIKPTL